MNRPRATKAALERLEDRLSARDLALLSQVCDLKLMSGAQIEAVHFTLADHATTDAAARACRRVLYRLTCEGALVRLERQIGGIRGGSAGSIYALSEVGHRLLSQDDHRRRFREPSITFVKHTLAVGQLVVDLIEEQRAKRAEILRLETEPRCWRTFRSTGALESLRPDLFVVLGVEDLEHHWFVELDMGTETITRRLQKCRQYQRYYTSGHEDDVFPKVLWIVPTDKVAAPLRSAIHAARSLRSELFEVCLHDEAIEHLKGGDS